jgi:hypothetical protein
MIKIQERLTLLGKLLTPVARSELLLADVREQRMEPQDVAGANLDSLEREWNLRVTGVSKTFRELGVDILK